MFSSRVLIALGLVWIAAAQDTYACVCDSSASKGFWSGPKCEQCDSRESNDFLDKQNPTECDEIEFCTDPKRDPIERDCYGAGRCRRADDSGVTLGTETKSTKSNPCECFKNPLDGTVKHKGDYCEECANGKSGWPACVTDLCEEIVPLVPDRECDGHGECTDSAASKSCGRQPYIPMMQSCLQGTDPTTGYKVFEVVTKGMGLEGQDQTLCGVRNGLAVVCSWDEECSKDASATSSLSDEQAPFANASPRCYKVGRFPCHDITGFTTTDCGPSETCCDGACCSSTEACIYEQSSAVVPYPTEANPSNRVTIYKSMSWVLPDGTDGGQYMTRSCEAQAHMSAPAAVRIVIMPIFLVLAVVVSFGLIMTAEGECGAAIKVPAILLVVCALLLSFSGYWPLGLLITLSGCVAIGGAKKGDSYVIAVALLFQFFALAVVCGGLGVGAFFVDATSGMNVADISDSSQTNWVVLQGCSKYFGYFEYNSIAAFKPANVEDREYYGYCSLGWHAVLYIVQALMVFSQVVMIVASGVAFIGK